MKLLLHACCGPCSLEPTRLLLAQGHTITIAYMNSNIHPAEEYRHRLTTIQGYMADQGIDLVEGPYDPQRWAREVGVYGHSMDTRPERCRACYRLRLTEAARYAAEHGFEALSTTLTVSPYQYTETIREELDAACAPYGIAPLFHDFRPYYPGATRKSRALGMYRQDFCGCAFSKVEADEERAQRKAQRAAEKAARDAELAPLRAAQEAARKENRRQKQEYAAKRAAQRAALKAFKAKARSSAEGEKETDA